MDGSWEPGGDNSSSSNDNQHLPVAISTSSSSSCSLSYSSPSSSPLSSSASTAATSSPSVPRLCCVRRATPGLQYHIEHQHPGTLLILTNRALVGSALPAAGMHVAVTAAHSIIQPPCSDASSHVSTTCQWNARTDNGAAVGRTIGMTAGSTTSGYGAISGSSICIGNSAPPSDAPSIWTGLPGLCLCADSVVTDMDTFDGWMALYGAGHQGDKGCHPSDRCVVLTSTTIHTCRHELCACAAPSLGDMRDARR